MVESLTLLLSLQYLRALAALLVVVQHAALKGTQYSTDPLGWFHIGGVGVDLFFIISGFIMCYTTQLRDISFQGFMANRLLRILPLYWLLTTVALVGFLLYPHLINSSGGHTSIFYSYTLLPTDSKYLVNNGWTLSYEFFFYILFAASLFFVKSMRHMIVVTLLALFIMLGIFYDKEVAWFAFMTDMLIAEFAMGIAAFHITRKYIFPSYVNVSFVFVGILALAYFNLYGPVGERALHYGVPAFFIVIGFLGGENVFQSCKNMKISRAFEMIGNASYSLYLVHPFSLVIVALVMKALGLTPYGGFFVFSLIIAAIVSGVLCYLIIEKPISKAVRKFHQKS